MVISRAFCNDAVDIGRCLHVRNWLFVTSFHRSGHFYFIIYLILIFRSLISVGMYVKGWSTASFVASSTVSMQCIPMCGVIHVKLISISLRVYSD